MSQIILYLLIISGPFTMNLYATFESNENLMKTIRAYLCYACFTWLKPLYDSLSKKICLSVEEDHNIDDEIAENKTPEEMTILTQQFQQLFNSYVHDIIDKGTSDYYKAKQEIERINQLLTTGTSIVKIEGKFFYQFTIELQEYTIFFFELRQLIHF